MAADEARVLLGACCGSTRWLDGMLAARPYASVAVLKETAARLSSSLDRADLLDAMRHHPRIGEAPKASANELREQAGAVSAGDAVKAALAEGNRAYEARFGHIYLVCATGKSGDELLALLTARLRNDPDTELAVAAAEQAKICALRIDKLLAAP